MLGYFGNWSHNDQSGSPPGLGAALCWKSPLTREQPLINVMLQVFLPNLCPVVAQKLSCSVFPLSGQMFKQHQTSHWEQTGQNGRRL